MSNERPFSPKDDGRPKRDTGAGLLKIIGACITIPAIVAVIVTIKILPGCAITAVQEKIDRDAMMSQFENYRQARITILAVDAQTQKAIPKFSVNSGRLLSMEKIKKSLSADLTKNLPNKPLRDGTKAYLLSTDKREFITIRAPGYQERVVSAKPGIDADFVIELKRKRKN